MPSMLSFVLPFFSVELVVRQWLGQKPTTLLPLKIHCRGEKFLHLLILIGVPVKRLTIPIFYLLTPYLLPPGHAFNAILRATLLFSGTCCSAVAWPKTDYPATLENPLPGGEISSPLNPNRRSDETTHDSNLLSPNSLSAAPGACLQCYPSCYPSFQWNLLFGSGLAKNRLPCYP